MARLSETLTSYIDEAIGVEESGLAVAPAPELVLVEELRRRFDVDPQLQATFLRDR